MSELQDNVLDDQNSDYTDLESLLAAANSSEFSISNGLTEEKQEFEKLNSFFEIVTSKDTKNLSDEDEVLNDLQVGSEEDKEGELCCDRLTESGTDCSAGCLEVGEDTCLEIHIS